MFHRVRSETSKEEAKNIETKEELALDTVAEDAEEEVEAATDETPEEKDEHTMSEAKQTAAVEEEPVSSYATTAPSPYSRGLGQGGYPGAYGSANPYPSAAPKAPARVERMEEAPATDRTLTIGAGITMSGEIESCDNLVVEGTVEAALKGARNLDIAQSGTFFGSVDIQEATIAGRFEGELTVHGRLKLEAGGVITGTIVYGELEIEAGALIDGRMTPIAAGQVAQQQQPSQKKTPQQPKARVGNSSQQSAANSEAGYYAAKA